MRAQPSPWTLAGLAILAAAALVFPWRVSDYLLHVTIISIYYAMLASSWALLAGYAGQFSFAHMALAALGGYSSALLVQYTGLPVPVGMVAGVLLPAITGGLIGWLCLRMSGPYLALFTLAFAVIFQLILIAEYEFTRGSLGLEVAPVIRRPRRAPVLLYEPSACSGRASPQCTRSCARGSACSCRRSARTRTRPRPAAWRRRTSRSWCSRSPARSRASPARSTATTSASSPPTS